MTTNQNWGCDKNLINDYPEGKTYCGKMCHGCGEIHFCPSCTKAFSQVRGLIEKTLTEIIELNDSRFVIEQKYVLFSGEVQDIIREVLEKIPKVEEAKENE